jgi:hypothetical protein
VDAFLVATKVSFDVLQLGGSEPEHARVASREVNRFRGIVGGQGSDERVRSEVHVVVAEDPPFDSLERRFHVVEEELQRHVQAAAGAIESFAVVCATIADQHVPLVTMHHRSVVPLFHERTSAVNLPLRVCASVARKHEVQMREVPAEGGDGGQGSSVVVRYFRAGRPGTGARLLHLLPPDIVGARRQYENRHFVGAEAVRFDDVGGDAIRRRCVAVIGAALVLLSRVLQSLLLGFLLMRSLLLLLIFML